MDLLQQPIQTLLPSLQTAVKTVPRIPKAKYVDPAELVGTPEWETCPIQSTEHRRQHGAVFLLGVGSRSRLVDGLVDVSDCLSGNAHARMAAARLLGEQDTVFEQTYRALRWIDMRRRAAIGQVEGPYLVRSSTPLTFGIIEQYLKSLSPDQLMVFLRSARF